jgi:Phage tail tube protein
MSKGIGRLFSIGVAKETTRGTAISSASYWLPFADASIEEKFDNVTQDEAYGIIEDAVGQFRVKNWAEGTIKVPLTDQALPLLLFSALGANNDSTHSGESIVYDHKATVGESAQHQSLTLFLHDPLAAVDYSHALGVIHKLELDVQLKKFAEVNLSVKALKGASQSTFTPSIATENRFLPQYMAFSYAPSTAGVNGTLTATGTASSTIHVTSLSINTNLLNVGMRVTATNLPAGATIATIVSSTAFDLSVATTGAIGTMTFNGAIVKLKSFKLTIDANVEDQEVLSNVAPVDFLNKEFKVEGSFEAIWQNESDFKTIALVTPNVAQALLVDIKNTDVSIGTSANPEVKILLDRCYFTEFSRPIKIKDLVYQSIKFKATYSTTNSEMIAITTVNTVASY